MLIRPSRPWRNDIGYELRCFSFGKNYSSKLFKPEIGSQKSKSSDSADKLPEKIFASVSENTKIISFDDYVEATLSIPTSSVSKLLPRKTANSLEQDPTNSTIKALKTTFVPTARSSKKLSANRSTESHQRMREPTASIKTTRTCSFKFLPQKETNILKREHRSSSINAPKKNPASSSEGKIQRNCYCCPEVIYT